MPGKSGHLLPNSVVYCSAATKAAADLVAHTGSVSVEEAVIRLVEWLRHSARALGFTEGVNCAPYDPWPLAAVLKANKVRDRSLGFDGRIVREGDGLTVEIDKAVASQQRRRFTLAHEVGHLALWEASGGRVRKNRSRRNSARSEIETLCNRIASEILAPWREVLHYLSAIPAEKDLFVVANTGVDKPNRLPSVLDIILRLSKVFDVSLQFSAVRVKEVCQLRASFALVRVSEKRLLWCVGNSPGDDFVDTALDTIGNTEQQGWASYWPSASQARGMSTFSWRRVGKELVLAAIYW